MHQTGWVHRDLTPGNFLFYRNEKGLRTKIVDVEYAKSMDNKCGHFARSVRYCTTPLTDFTDTHFALGLPGFQGA